MDFYTDTMGNSGPWPAVEQKEDGGVLVDPKQMVIGQRYPFRLSGEWMAATKGYDEEISFYYLSKEAPSDA